MPESGASSHNNHTQNPSSGSERERHSKSKFYFIQKRQNRAIARTEKGNRRPMRDPRKNFWVVRTANKGERKTDQQNSKGESLVVSLGRVRFVRIRLSAALFLTVVLGVSHHDTASNGSIREWDTYC